MLHCRSRHDIMSTNCSCWRQNGVVIASCVHWDHDIKANRHWTTTMYWETKHYSPARWWPVSANVYWSLKRFEALWYAHFLIRQAFRCPRLIHWSLVTHTLYEEMCHHQFSNDFSPVWHQAITKTKAYLSSIEPLTTNFANLDQNTKRIFQTNAVEKSPIKYVINIIIKLACACFEPLQKLSWW